MALTLSKLTEKWAASLVLACVYVVEFFKVR